MSKDIHLFHKWGKWEVYTIEGTFIAGRLVPKSVQGQMFNSTELRQKRVCKTCGYTQDEWLRDGSAP